MKEAYVKAHGQGLGLDIQNIETSYIIDDITKFPRDLSVKFAGKILDPPWGFEMFQLDNIHVATVAKAPPQHCDAEFAGMLPQRSLTADEMRASSLIPKRPFSFLTIADLLRPEAQQDLMWVRSRWLKQLQAVGLLGTRK